MSTGDHLRAVASRCASRGGTRRSPIPIIVFAALAGFWVLPQAASAAANVNLALSPASIPNDGVTASVATVSVPSVIAGNESITFTSTGASPVTFSATTCLTGLATASCSVQVTSSTAGSATITATDGTTFPGQSASQLLTVTGPPARIALTLTPPSITADGLSSSAAAATVTDSAGNPLSSETVDFRSNGTPVAFSSQSCITNATGTCTVGITGTTVGFTTITATDSNPLGSSPTTSQTLAETALVPANVSVQLSPSTIQANGLASTTAVATVTDASNNLVTTANVSFKSSDPGQTIGAVTNNGNGTYSAQIRSSTTVGSSTITATAGSAQGGATLIQAAGSSVTTLVASPPSLVTNQPVTLAATVSSGTGAPSGTITFQNGGTTIPGCSGEAVSQSSPIATCQTSFAASGSPARLTAAFTPGPGSTAPASSGGLDLTIGPDSTSVSLQTPSSTTTRRAITYTAAVTPPTNRPGPVVPTGTVQFSDNGQLISTCAAQPIVNGAATCTVTYRQTGAHTIRARYSGDGNFAGSSALGAQLSVVVLRARIIGSLNETMQWSFRFTSFYTKVLQLVVNGASAGDAIHATCRGQGCPFTRRTIKVAKRMHCTRKRGKRKCSMRGPTTVQVPLQGHRLYAGARFTVSITRRNWIGKFYSFTIRSRRGPRIQISCLTPGYSKPGLGCST